MTTTLPTPPSHHLHAFNFQTGRPRFHFDEASDAAAAAASSAASAAKPWHDGVDTELIGHAQNKGWKLDDPKESFSAAAKVARDLERHFGVPADRIVKIPAADAKSEDIRAYYERIGAPKEANEYDLSAVKDPAIADSLRATMHERGVSKDAASALAASVAKALESATTTQTTLDAAKLVEEKAKLKTNWGDKYDYNHLQAMEGARKAGISQEGVKAIESQIGYADTMEHFRRVGSGMSEDAFHQGGGPNGNPTTREGARAKLSELEADKAWGKRLTSGDPVAGAEWRALTALIDADAA